MKSALKSWPLRLVALGIASFAVGAFVPGAKPALAGKGGGTTCRVCEFDSASFYNGYSCMATNDWGGIDCYLWNYNGFIKCMTIGFCAGKVINPRFGF